METNTEYLTRLLPLLKKPIPHQWRVQSFSKNKPVATVMAYIDQRDLMDALDTHCTYGWQKKYEEIAGNLFCSIGINMPDGTTQWRSDCGVESNQDAEKGRASDAAKRAGVNWGVGRFLYDMKIQYVTTNEAKTASNYPYCIDEKGNKIWDLTEYVNNLNAPKQPTLVKEPTTDEKASMMQNRTNPELPSGIAQSILDATTEAQLKVIWESNQDLHVVKKFTDAVATRKKELLAKK